MRMICLCSSEVLSLSINILLHLANCEALLESILMNDMVLKQ